MIKQFFLCLLLLPLSALGDLHSYALVNDDGTIQVRGRTVHLYGIYIPETNYNCQTFIRPVQCGQRAALALKLKIQGFVRCEEISRNKDRSINAICRVDVSSFSEGEDLAAYLLRRGWAVALPDAPFEYSVLERIARKQSVGVWGFPVDNIHR